MSQFMTPEACKGRGLGLSEPMKAQYPTRCCKRPGLTLSARASVTREVDAVSAPPRSSRPVASRAGRLSELRFLLKLTAKLSPPKTESASTRPVQNPGVDHSRAQLLQCNKAPSLSFHLKHVKLSTPLHKEP